MADGKEDLADKKRGWTPPSPKFTSWKHSQGREDAEMLQEKSAGWSSRRANRGDYDRDDD